MQHYPSLVPRPSRLQFLIASNQKLEPGRPGNEQAIKNWSREGLGTRLALSYSMCIFPSQQHNTKHIPPWMTHCRSLLDQYVCCCQETKIASEIIPCNSVGGYLTQLSLVPRFSLQVTCDVDLEIFAINNFSPVAQVAKIKQAKVTCEENLGTRMQTDRIMY